MFPSKGVGEALHLPDHLGSLGRRIGRNGAQALPEAGHPHRNDGHTVHRGIETAQLPQGAVQGGPVVDAGAGDHLAVHRDPRPGKLLHDGQTFPRPMVFQQTGPQLRVRGVDGNVDGADVQVHNPLELPSGQIGQCDIITHQEGQPGVVVLEIERLPHAGGHLVHKAENTAIGTGTGPVHQIGLKIEAQVLPFRLPHPDGALPAVFLFQFQDQPGVIGMKFIVQHVHDGVAVDFGQGLPDPYSRPPGRTVWVYRPDFGQTHGRASFSVLLYPVSGQKERGDKPLFFSRAFSWPWPQ